MRLEQFTHSVERSDDEITVIYTRTNRMNIYRAHRRNVYMNIYRAHRRNLYMNIYRAHRRNVYMNIYRAHRRNLYMNIYRAHRRNLCMNIYNIWKDHPGWERLSRHVIGLEKLWRLWKKWTTIHWCFTFIKQLYSEMAAKQVDVHGW